MGMELERIIPKDTVVKIGGKEYELRKVNLHDEVWMKSSFGVGEEYTKVFSEAQFDKICKLVFRLLKDKKDFTAIEVEDFDDDGNPVKRVMTAPERIMEAISGADEATEVFMAVMETIGISRQVFNKVVDEELKKKTTKSQTGQKSSTQSRASTGTRLKK